MVVLKRGKDTLNGITHNLLGRTRRIQSSQLLHHLPHILRPCSALFLNNPPHLGLNLLLSHGLRQINLQHLNLLVLLCSLFSTARRFKAGNRFLTALDGFLDEDLDDRVSDLFGGLRGFFEVCQITQDSLLWGIMEREGVSKRIVNW